ncbi:hypothetical protein V6N12_066072 [Hibiscus sabdariffa]|uniref:Reverse transcriptase zinc-binding domain-containing protein n=1 Tax=Hibiscus sabdariffa TaxID=183260 RepID=A0ABR2AS59_9ROSI
MPLPSTPQPDLLVWRADRTSTYSVKSGYKVLLQGLASIYPSETVMPSTSIVGLYYRIWKANVPSKVRITVWRFVRNYIPTFGNLTVRGIAAHTACLLCDGSSETAFHLISTCVFSRRIFSALHITLPQVLLTSDWLPWLANFVNGLSVTHCRLLFLAIWAIWGHCNKVVHDHAAFDLPSFINFIKSYMNDMDTLPPIASSSVLSFEEKCAGDVLAAGCFSHHNVLDPFAAEALACYQALVLAHDLSYMRIVLEGDSLSVIKKVRHFFEDRSVIGMLIKDIKRKMGSFDSTTVLFCPRACNKPAHYIAHLGHSIPTPCIWIGNIPHQVDQLAIKDKWWTDPPNLSGINL